MLSSVSASTERTTAWPAPAGGPQFVAIDSNGNLTSKVEDGHSWTYEWNAENELKRVLKDAVEVARFAYDPTGRRVEKVVGGLATTYTYDRMDILRQVTGATSLRYVHGPSADEPLATEDGGGQLTYEHADGLGSALKGTNASGAVISSRSYDAFGQLQSGASTPGYAFTGREWDPEIGLYYYRARYYDPAQGRFIGEDPIGFAGGVNLFSYAGGSPASFVDPSGLAVLPPNFTGPPAPGDIWQNQATITANAISQVGKTDWSWWYRKNEVRPFAFKCNLFVNDVLKASGVPVPKLHGKFGPVAADWGNPGMKIACCDVVTGPPQPGDVMSIPDAGPGYTGHVAIYVGMGLSVSQSAVQDEVVMNDWGSRPGQHPTVRRCTCGN